MIPTIKIFFMKTFKNCLSLLVTSILSVVVGAKKPQAPVSNLYI